ncbi:hypothetical protein O0I10_004932 [Lichtheimia ornata]|uniref:Uncharacterized protein n=1 Tax=Lichtheimia ornata TaxID=688661 RepID=A0AAD7V601_9FUNG|nr:uncharacterized protein O0I10_004932 [Lichtheimia ornata]KAJ8659218.1 hypothetical protein O0I10_004932 [Lichtheimia ornata]
MSPFLITVGNISIDSGNLYAFFLSLLLGNAPLNNNNDLWGMAHYCNHLFAQAGASTEVVILSMIYAQRLVAAVGAARLTELVCNIGYGGDCLLITVATRLACKWHDDDHMWWRLVEWGPVSGIPLRAIDEFEWIAAEAMNFQFFVSESEYNAFASGLASLFAAPLPPLTPRPMSGPSSSSSLSPLSPPLVPIKTEPGVTPLAAVKLEPPSPPTFLPAIKVEELDDEHALLAAMLVRGEDNLRAVSMPEVPEPTTTTNINSSLRFSV